MVGANIFITGMADASFTNHPAPQYKTALPTKPITRTYSNALLNILCAFLYSPTANLCEITFETAAGILYEEISNTIV